jgi:hypothetical protein
MSDRSAFQIVLFGEQIKGWQNAQMENCLIISDLQAHLI